MNPQDAQKFGQKASQSRSHQYPKREKGDTVLQQAARHGASVNVVGEVLALEVDCGPRKDEGGMGWQSFWSEEFIPMMQQRLLWLRETWRC